jgi:membrane protease YdiL (CAAX protease family)
VIYTVVYSLHPSDPLAAVLEIIPGILAVCTLVVAGFQRETYYLQIAPVSRAGAALLVTSIIFVPFVLLSGRWTGWNWTILIQSMLFAVWHIPNAYMGGAPVVGVIAVVVVTFLCGLLWSSQVQRDGTVIWVMMYHTLLLMINSLFTWG